MAWKLDTDDRRRIDRQILLLTNGAFRTSDLVSDRQAIDYLNQEFGCHISAGDAIVEYAIGAGLISLEEDFAN